MTQTQTTKIARIPNPKGRRRSARDELNRRFMSRSSAASAAPTCRFTGASMSHTPAVRSDADAPPFVAAADALAAMRADDDASMEDDCRRLFQQAFATQDALVATPPMRVPGESGSLADSVLDADLLGVCFLFLDSASLSICERVSTRWHAVLQDPRLWEQFYCHTWRASSHGTFEPRAHRQALLPHLRAICKTRARTSHSVRLSTRARSWMRKNGNVFVHNDELRRNMALGCTESIRTVRALPLLACAAPLGVRVSYFEATLSGCGSVGVASVSTISERQAYGAGSESHLGWYPVSYGYHGDDGLFYWNASRRPFGALGGTQRAFGPVWGDTTPFRERRWRTAMIGCGLVVDTRELFFTLNGAFVGFAPVTLERRKEFAAAVSLHQFGDSAELNFGANAFAFDVERFVWETLRPRVCPSDLSDSSECVTAIKAAAPAATGG